MDSSLAAPCRFCQETPQLHVFIRELRLLVPLQECVAMDKTFAEYAHSSRKVTRG